MRKVRKILTKGETTMLWDDMEIIEVQWKEPVENKGNQGADIY